MRFGLVGLGWAARGYHLPALSTVPNAEVVGGVDADEAQRSAWTKRTGAPAFETLDELLAATLPDVVIVATPPDSHADLCIAALEGGAHVICEKPFVMNRRGGRQRARGRGRAPASQVAVNHEYREKPIFRAVKSGSARRTSADSSSARSGSSWTSRRGTSRSPGAPRCPTGRCSRAACTSST